MKRNFLQFIKELAIVIFGVLIALLINNLNETRKDKKYLNQMMLSIREELKQTNLEIEEKMEQQQVLMDTLNFYANDCTISIYNTLVKADGIHLPTIRIYSWKTISSAKIELLKPEDIRILSDIEQQRDVLDM